MHIVNDVQARTALPNKVVRLIDELAASCPMTRSQMIRFAVFKWLTGEGYPIDSEDANGNHRVATIVAAHARKESD